MPARDDYPEPAAELIQPQIMAAAVRKKPRAREAELRLSNGTWARCEVIAWARNQAGWVILVRWPGRPGQSWYQYAAALIRPTAPSQRHQQR